MGLHQGLAGSIVQICQNHSAITAFHSVHTLPARHHIDVLLSNPIRAGDFQTLEPVFDKIAVGFVQDGLGSRLISYKNGNGRCSHHGHCQKGYQIFPDRPVQMGKLCFLHYQTNSLALSGWWLKTTSDTTPPFMRITRFAILAISSLWVTISRVVPALMTFSRTDSTSMLVS